jgi:hypothetical protein
MLKKMAKQKRNADIDEIDRVLAHANPNPQRIGCLPRETLESLASRRQPLNAPGYEHLLECSECYREFRTLQGVELNES